MEEIELKFQVPAHARAAVGAAVAGASLARRMRLQAAYLDTPTRLLAQAGLALRVRREGRLWVQTLKGAGDDGMTRLEHNVPLASGAAPPLADPARHAGTPVGDRLLALLAAHPGDVLGVRFRTDVMRRTRLVRTAHGQVEMAFDEGHIIAGEARIGLCELEIELKQGAALAVIETARRWVPRHGLWFDSRSKAERGDMLARGETVAAPRDARAVALAKAQPLAEARQQVLRSCADQVIVNASQVAAGGHGDEHVHQLRVGLRRLRTALRLFAAVDAEPGAAAALDAAAAALFRGLGQGRDAAVTGSAFGADLAAALRSAGLADAVGGAPRAAHDATVLLRSVPAQALLLDLLGATTAPLAHTVAGAPATAKLRAELSGRLARWHQSAAADAKAFGVLDDAGRHRLRKRVKRLRYAVEFGATLFHAGAVRRYLLTLRRLQDSLGEINDVVVAMQAYRSRCDADPLALFALGWLVARRDALLAQARPQAKAFAKAKGFWKSR